MQTKIGDGNYLVMINERGVKPSTVCLFSTKSSLLDVLFSQQDTKYLIQGLGSEAQVPLPKTTWAVHENRYRDNVLPSLCSLLVA